MKMRKRMVILMLFLAITLSGCTNPETEPDPDPDPSICNEGELLIDEECKVLSGPEIQLYHSINNTKMFSGYDMNVTLSNSLESVSLVIEVDDNTTIITIDSDRTITYLDNGVTCNIVEVFLGSEIAYTEDCQESEKYSFFREFEYSWFTLESGKYQLQENNYIDVENLLSGILADATIVNVSLSVQDGYISEIVLVAQINGDEYTIDMSISNPKFITIPYEVGGVE